MDVQAACAMKKTNVTGESITIVAAVTIAVYQLRHVGNLVSSFLKVLVLVTKGYRMTGDYRLYGIMH